MLAGGRGGVQCPGLGGKPQTSVLPGDVVAEASHSSVQWCCAVVKQREVETLGKHFLFQNTDVPSCLSQVGYGAGPGLAARRSNGHHLCDLHSFM